jgi:hypothetical protein
MGKRRNALLVTGQVLLDALGGRLGVPIMVAGYLLFAALLLAYVSTQVYTNTLMEDVAARKRREVALKERIGVLTARYATMTSKSRVSAVCEEKLGLVESTTRDVVRVVVDGTDMPDESVADEVRVDEVLGSDNNGLTQVMRQ